MKKIVSLLSVAVLAMTFAAGCGKHGKCADANDKGKKYCEAKANFENDKECKYTPTAADKPEGKGKCEDKAATATTTGTFTANDTAIAKCKRGKADKAACEAVNPQGDDSRAADKCKWDNNKAADDRCFPVANS